MQDVVKWKYEFLRRFSHPQERHQMFLNPPSARDPQNVYEDRIASLPVHYTDDSALKRHYVYTRPNCPLAET